MSSLLTDAATPADPSSHHSVLLPPPPGHVPSPVGQRDRRRRRLYTLAHLLRRDHQLLEPGSAGRHPLTPQQNLQGRPRRGAGVGPLDSRRHDNGHVERRGADIQYAG